MTAIPIEFDVMKAKLAEVGADTVQTSADLDPAFDVGPIECVRLEWKHIVIQPGAEYYVDGIAHDLYELALSIQEETQ